MALRDVERNNRPSNIQPLLAVCEKIEEREANNANSASDKVKFAVDKVPRNIVLGPARATLLGYIQDHEIAYSGWLYAQGLKKGLQQEFAQGRPGVIIYNSETFDTNFPENGRWTNFRSDMGFDWEEADAVGLENQKIGKKQALSDFLWEISLPGIPLPLFEDYTMVVAGQGKLQLEQLPEPSAMVNPLTITFPTNLEGIQIANMYQYDPEIDKVVLIKQAVVFGQQAA